MILAQSAATSRAYAAKYDDSFNENVDLVGLGLANIGAGISGTFVVNGSPTKTEMVDSAGGRSQIAQLTAGAIVLVVILFLTGPLSYMPNAVLAAVVFLIGLRLIDVRGMLQISRLRPGEFVVALLTAATVVIVGVEQGIFLAIILSVVEHIFHSYRPYDTLLTITSENRVKFAPIADATQAEPGLLVYRFGSGIYYANATRFTEETFDLFETADPKLRWFCLSASAIGDIDYSGADAIRQLHGELARAGATLVLADVSPRVRKQLDAYGLTEKIGAGNFFEDAYVMLEAFRKLPPAPPGAAPGRVSRLSTHVVGSASRGAPCHRCRRARSEPGSVARPGRRSRSMPTRPGRPRPAAPTRSRCWRSRGRAGSPRSFRFATGG